MASQIGTFEGYLAALARQLALENGDGVAQLFDPAGAHAVPLVSRMRNPTRASLEAQYKGKFASPWDEVCIAHILVIVQLQKNNSHAAYLEQATLVNTFMRVFQAKSGWTLSIMYQALRDLRLLADAADEKLQVEGKPPSCNEDAARLCNKAFTSCITDRQSKLPQSRKWGVYYVVGLVFKSYFKLNRLNLCKNVIRALEANKDDIPALSEYPLSDQVTFRYYTGIISFLQEDYAKAEADLSFASDNCHFEATRNQERILTFLVPLRLFLKGVRPSPFLLAKYPAIEGLYGEFLRAMQKGDVVAFDDALARLESRLVAIGNWIIIIKLREVALRGVFKKVWKTLGSATRVSIPAFHAGLRIAGQDIDVEEAECLVANSIYKGYMKGYISHEAQMVVLAKANTFPRMADRVLPVGMQS